MSCPLKLTLLTVRSSRANQIVAETLYMSLFSTEVVYTGFFFGTWAAFEPDVILFILT